MPLRALLAGLALACCQGAAGALGTEAAASDSALFQLGLRSHSTGRRSDRQLPVWDWERPAGAAVATALARNRAHLARGQIARVEEQQKMAADWMSNHLGLHADLAHASLARGSSGWSLCNTSVRLPCKFWLGYYKCSTKWSDVCPGIDSADGPQYNQVTLGSACSAECAIGGGPTQARVATRAPALPGWRAFSPCDPSVQLPCSYWTQAYACDTTWLQACPGVDNPAGSQYNNVPISAACPAQCAEATTPAPAPAAPAAASPGLTHVFPALCNTTTIATCKMWTSVYPSCTTTWEEACPGVDNPAGVQYNSWTVQQSCPTQCAEKAAAKACSNTDFGLTDKGNYDCKLGYVLPNYCGFYDDGDFTAEDMCCSCGGGGAMKEPPRGAAEGEMPESPAIPLATSEVAATALVTAIASGSQRLTVTHTTGINSGDILMIANGPVSEMITVYVTPDEPEILHVKAGLANSYSPGAVITTKVKASSFWCSGSTPYDCQMWGSTFHCMFSYSTVCPGVEPPYDPSLATVPLSVMCPRECYVEKSQSPAPAAAASGTAVFDQ